MPYFFRFLRAKRLKANEVQAKIPMITGPRSKRSFELIPVRDPEIYPLLVCVLTGFGLLAVYNVHNFLLNPEIKVSKIRRETPVFTEEPDEVVPEVVAFTKHRPIMAALRPNSINTSEDFHDKSGPNGEDMIESSSSKSRLRQ
ncbi:TPA: hypothetical protein N0F65_013037 [Lagenidium giganteum]|uniref:Uncharacterized protein n=1 Tax=Lagenidium giganteum TaxID=4803 RepID=A0AAV2YKS2_9STRA|nr:TPA: hypothetical protein N0F65_013037 [Lagenidium giganteum]